MTEPAESAGAGHAPGVGSFRFWFIGERWEWSDELARMHGYQPGTAVPTTELLMSHKHPDDRAHVQDLLDRALHSGEPFSSRHRFLDTAGVVHDVLVVADRMFDNNGAVVGTTGYYVDLTNTFADTRQDVLDEQLPWLFEARAAIDQAKGALMVVYRISAEHAFAILQWRSQETNTKVRALAQALLADIPKLTDSAVLRSEFDHLLLTAHNRAGK